MTPPCQSTGPAAQQWAEALAAGAIPEEVLAAAPQSPYGFDVGMFARLADEALDQETPSQQMAREALSHGGRVLDVGCGGGAASLPLAPPATFIVGLDQSAAMLQAFAQRAAARGVVHETIEGAWPDVADQPRSSTSWCATTSSTTSRTSGPSCSGSLSTPADGWWSS